MYESELTLTSSTLEPWVCAAAGEKRVSTTAPMGIQARDRGIAIRSSFFTVESHGRTMRGRGVVLSSGSVRIATAGHRAISTLAGEGRLGVSAPGRPVCTFKPTPTGSPGQGPIVFATSGSPHHGPPARAVVARVPESIVSVHNSPDSSRTRSCPK